ncbi:MAG TPA: hypothetical protein VFA90_20890 [Terriglobales bacterium]|nr:hypothetical protein [Terriglobales bacterium]
MSSRLVSIFLFLLFTSTFGWTQTATCSNWNVFQLPSSWDPPYLIDYGGINRWGTIVGSATPNNSYISGFVRYIGGGFSTFKAPQSSPASSTFFTRRNNSGVTVGYYGDSSYRVHGIVVSGSKSVTVDYPGAFYTMLYGINNWGTIVGVHYDGQGGSGYPLGFKLKDGKFTRIYYPDSILTVPNSINDKAAIVGYYWDQKMVQHGFILENGIYKTLDNPKNNPQFTPNGNELKDINGSGTIVGYYYVGQTIYSFLYSNGVFKDILPENGSNTVVEAINGYGDVLGITDLSSGKEPFFTARCH